MQTTDLKHLFDLLRCNQWLIVLGLLLGSGAAFIASRLPPMNFAPSLPHTFPSGNSHFAG